MVGTLCLGTNWLHCAIIADCKTVETVSKVLQHVQTFRPWPFSELNDRSSYFDHEHNFPYLHFPVNLHSVLAWKGCNTHTVLTKDGTAATPRGTQLLALESLPHHLSNLARLLSLSQPPLLTHLTVLIGDVCAASAYLAVNTGRVPHLAYSPCHKPTRDNFSLEQTVVTHL